MSDPVEPTNNEDETEELEPQEGTEPQVEAEEDTEPEQDEFDKDRALAKIKKINSENKALRQRATDAEKKAKDAEGKDARVTALEADNLRLSVGVELGLPAAIIKRLTGSTKEELIADAEELLGLISKKSGPPREQPKEKLRGGGDPTQEPDGLDDPDTFAERMFRR